MQSQYPSWNIQESGVMTDDQLFFADQLFLQSSYLLWITSKISDLIYQYTYLNSLSRHFSHLDYNSLLKELLACAKKLLLMIQNTAANLAFKVKNTLILKYTLFLFLNCKVWDFLNIL